MMLNFLKDLYRFIFPKKEIAGSPQWFRKGEIKSVLNLLRELKEYVDIKDITSIKLKYNNLITVENQKDIFIQLDKLKINKDYFVIGSYFGIQFIEMSNGVKYMYFKIYDRNVDREVLLKEVEEDVKFSELDHDLQSYKDGTVYPILEKSDKKPFKINLDRV